MSSEPKSLYNSFHQSEFTKKILFSTTGATTAELITTPICTIKTVYQTSNYRTPWIATTAIYRQRGFWGFYSGAYPAIMSQIVSCSSKFTFYHVFKTYRSTKDRDLFNNSLNGMMGGILGSILVHPLDVIKNYRQRHEPFIPDLKSIGPSLLYRGYSQNFVKNIMLYSMLFPLNDYYKTIGLNTILAAI